MKATSKLAAGAAVVGILTMAGCSPDVSGPTEPSGEFGDTKEITFVNPGGDWLDAVVNVWGKSFEEKTGVRVLGDSPAAMSSIIQQVESGNVTWDVVEVPPQFTLAYCGTYFEKFDRTLVDFDLLIEGYGNECGVPTNGYANLLFFNDNTYGSSGPEGWADFFDTKKFPGVRALWNGAEGANLELALLADGVAPEDLYPLDYDRAFAKLDSIRDDLVFWESGAQSTQMMEAAEVDMIMAWSTRGKSALENGAPFTPVWNQHIINNNVQAIPLGSKNKAAAEAFIEWSIQEEQQTVAPEHFPILPGLKGVKPQLDSYSEAVYVNDERLAASITLNHQWLSENREEILERWTAWLNK